MSNQEYLEGEDPEYDINDLNKIEIKNVNSKKIMKKEEQDDKKNNTEQLLKLRDLPRRKSSTGSTSSSKPEDPSELFSYPSSPKSLNSQEFNKSGIFFSKDRNCSKNNIFNFYQIN